MIDLFSTRRLWLTAAALTLAACGGDPQLAGIEGTGDTAAGAVSAGTVTSFGSIYVNGTRFTTSDAVIFSNGQRVDEEAIQVGMVVRVEGRLDAATGEGVADRVVQDRLIGGPVSELTEIDASAKQLLVLGQKVIARDDIAYHGLAYEDLTAGLVLDISGFIDSAGVVVATRIATREASAGFDLEGVVTTLNSAARRVQVGQLWVHYANAQLDPSEPELAEGALVEVQGVQFDSAGRLVADVVRVKPAISVEAGVHLQVEGLIRDFESSTAFRVDGVAIDASQATVKRGSVNRLAEGVRVSVAGTTDADGLLQAESVELILPSEIRVRGPIDSVDAETGTLVVLGNSFYSDRLTTFEDRSAMANRFINLGRLSQGDRVEVFAREVDGEYVVTQLRRLNDVASTNVVLDGTVTAVNGPSFQMLGWHVDASNAEGADLADLQVGVLVRVMGRVTGSDQITADQVQVLPAMTCVNLPLQANCERPATP